MQHFTISELVALTGVPPATVHYYLRQGLLPRPRRVSANRFLYDERHARGLKLIRMLRDQRGLDLAMIRRIMPELLSLDSEEAFRPEMWDRSLAPRLSRRRLPSRRLLDAAKDSFARRGYGDVNVDDICRAARIAKGSFYRHYRSKEELFFAAAESLADDVVAAFKESVGLARPSCEEGAEVLAALIERALPIFLELFARSLQGRPEYAAAAGRIFGRATAELGQLLSGPGSPRDRGGKVVGLALSTIFARSVATHDVPVPRPGGLRSASSRLSL